MRARKLTLSLSLSMPGDVQERVGARWRLAPRPSHPVPCAPGGQAECFLRVAVGAPSLSPGPQLLCLVGWSPGSYRKAQGHWREGWGRSRAGCLARLPFPRSRCPRSASAAPLPEQLAGFAIQSPIGGSGRA